MKEGEIHAGIDVGAKSLAVCVMGRAVFQREFSNDSAGHAGMVKKLESLGVTHVCLEPTGSYSLDIALALVAGGFEVMVANPRAVRHCVNATLTGSTCVAEDIKRSIVHLKERISELEDAALAVITKDSTLQLRYELVLSVPGIGKASAISLLAELSVLPTDMTVRQWVAHAGLDPRHRCSGTSVHGKVRVSKTGNARIRKALFLPALTAVRYVPEIKNRLQQLKATA